MDLTNKQLENNQNNQLIQANNNIQKIDNDLKDNNQEQNNKDIKIVKQQFKCTICQKQFNKKVDLDIHKKNKHQNQTQTQPIKKPKNNIRNRVLQMQQNQHQDTIYSYLGQLGQKNQQTNNRQQLLLSDQNQRQNIQTNYSFNKVVRTPYQKQIVEIDLIPWNWINQVPNSQLIKIYAQQMTLLYKALAIQKQRWQYRDPMAPQQQAQDEFSLMQIRKLISNYSRRNLQLKYPMFSIFILWVGRICKPTAWQQFFKIIATYLSQYYNSQQSKKQQKPSDKWDAFHLKFDKQDIPTYLTKKLSICDQKTIKKFCQHFYKWTQLYDLVNQFC